MLTASSQLSHRFGAKKRLHDFIRRSTQNATKHTNPIAASMQRPMIKLFAVTAILPKLRTQKYYDIIQFISIVRVRAVGSYVARVAGDRICPVRYLHVRVDVKYFFVASILAVNAVYWRLQPLKPHTHPPFK